MHLNVTAHPTAQWVWRQLIAATPWGEQPRYLIRDRDRCYGGGFIPHAARLGIETLLTPVRAAKANAIAERLVDTLRVSVWTTSSSTRGTFSSSCTGGAFEACRSAQRGPLPP